MSVMRTIPDGLYHRHQLEVAEATNGASVTQAACSPPLVKAFMTAWGGCANCPSCRGGRRLDVAEHVFHRSALFVRCV